MKKKYSKKLIIRTLLFSAGHNEKYIKKAFSTNADVVVLDLEDATPKNSKSKARKMIKKVLESNIVDNRPIYVRVNSIESGFLSKDINAIASKNLTGFVFPKIYNTKCIKLFSEKLATKEKELKLPIGYFNIIALIETPEAVLDVYNIAFSSPRIKGLLFGSEDFLQETEGEHNSIGTSILVPRHMISMAAKAAKISAIDTPYVDIGNFEGLKEHIKQAKQVGFEGMLVMSPREIPIVEKLYTPSKKEITEAQEIIKLHNRAIKTNRGIAVYNNIFISPPTIEKAKKTINKHKAIISFQNYRKNNETKT